MDFQRPSRRWSLRCPPQPVVEGCLPGGVSARTSLLVTWPPPASCCEEKEGLRKGLALGIPPHPCPFLTSLDKYFLSSCYVPVIF